ncbi:MAG: alpha/beta fold hydrolase [Thermoanaerobaculia bacterium]|nr:alpha/beta fold hydrolase [Thermoanaerobaculia bacterium]
MPQTVANGVRIHYVEEGTGSETVVLSHSYLVDHRHFEAQIDALAEDYRVLAYDHRDHGRSQRMSGSYGMEEIYQDGVSFLETVGAPPCHWIGLSAGGFVGLRIAIRRPELLRSLVVLDSAADLEPPLQRLKYRLMLLAVGTVGFRPVVGQGMKAMFGRDFLRAPARQNERELWRKRIQANGRKATVRFGKAIFGRDSVEEELDRIEAPTLVAVGDQDRAVSPERARRTAEGIPEARFETISDCGHLSTVEQPQRTTRLLSSFLEAPDSAGTPD